MSRIFLLAAEPSGDQLGARLAAALREMAGNRLELAGMGGPAMAEHGIEGPYDTSKLAVMGLAEVVPKIPQLLRRIRQTCRWIVKAQPAAVVTIDSPDFMHRVVAKARPLCPNTAFVNYVAPTVWMWRAKRVHRIAQLYDLQLALLPFEPPYFETSGVRCAFVGHPAVETAADGLPSKREARRLLGLDDEAPVAVALPGSRRSEIHRHGKVFGEALALLARQVPGLEVILPMAPGVESKVRGMTESWQPKPLLVEAGSGGPASRWTAYAAADVALAASGTVTVELAAAGLPMAVAYRLSPLTWTVLRRLAKRRHASLVNLMLDEDAVPEFLQGRCQAKPIAKSLARLLEDRAAAALQQSSLERAAAMLWGVGESSPPSMRAARAVWELASSRAETGTAAS